MKFILIIKYDIKFKNQNINYIKQVEKSYDNISKSI